MLAVVAALLWLWWDLRKQKASAFIRDAQSEELYLRDLNARLRAVPDEDTFTYLTHALGFSGRVVEMQPQEIDKARGERIMPVRKWKRPLTPEEEAKEELRHKVSSRIEVADLSFELDATPQSLVVAISNRNQFQMYIASVKFQPSGLSLKDFPSDYRKANVSCLEIPLQDSERYLDPDTRLTLELKLQQRWERSALDLLRGKLGWLHLDIVYKGERLKDILLSI